MSAKAISVNTLSIQDSNYLVSEIVYRNIPSKSINILQKSRNDGFIFQNSYYTDKTITISGFVSDTSEALLKVRIDTLKEYLSADTFNIDIDDGGTTVRYVGSLESLSIPEKYYSITTVPFTMTLKCQPFGKLTSATTSTNSIEAATYTASINPTGSIAPKPSLKWACSTMPTSAITQIVFANSTTGDTITVPSLAMDASGDYLKIDTDTMTVEVSHDGGAATAIDYTGVLPSFAIGSNSYSVTVTGGGASWKLLQTVSYYPTYL